jgi:hypothetical protein
LSKSGTFLAANVVRSHRRVFSNVGGKILLVFHGFSGVFGLSANLANIGGGFSRFDQRKASVLAAFRALDLGAHDLQAAWEALDCEGGTHVCTQQLAKPGDAAAFAFLVIWNKLVC